MITATVRKLLIGGEWVETGEWIEVDAIDQAVQDLGGKLVRADLGE